MGPTGVRSLLFEMHTLRFNILQAQYLEALFEQAHDQQMVGINSEQPNLHAYLAANAPSFGNFSDCQGYAGFVPSVHYLSDMMAKAIELEEADAPYCMSCTRSACN